MPSEKDTKDFMRGAGFEQTDLADRFNQGMKKLFGGEAPRPMKKKKKVKRKIEGPGGTWVEREYEVDDE